MIVYGELPSADALGIAIERLREIGYEDFDTLAPYELPQEGSRSHIPRWALVGGIFGLLSAYSCQTSIHVVAWPLDVGGRPLHSAPAWIPITFELTILFASLATFAGLIVKGRLGTLWKPIDEHDEIRSSTLDKFWIGIRGDDARRDLERVGVTRIVEVEE